MLLNLSRSNQNFPSPGQQNEPIATGTATTRFLQKAFQDPPSALLDEPPLPLRAEEGVHEVVVGLLRDPERLVPDGAVDHLEHVPRQVAAAVHAAVLPHELLLGDGGGPAAAGGNVRVVQGRVQHDDGEGEDVAGVAVLEQACWVKKINCYLTF